jgi:hypothetical protein
MFVIPKNIGPKLGQGEGTTHLPNHQKVRAGAKPAPSRYNR